MKLFQKIKLKNLNKNKCLNEGNISIEFIFILSLFLFITLNIINPIQNQNELNIIMASAKAGSLDGADISSMSIYSKNTFDNYFIDKKRLLYPSNIKIIKIEYIKKGYNKLYNKNHIQLKVFVSSRDLIKTQYKQSVGDRINFNVRKQITKSFKTENITNDLYNPCFSKHYIITTADVNWQRV